MPNTITTSLRDRITGHRLAFNHLDLGVRADTRKWDNRPTWDNRGGKWDSRPGWDNWTKK
ncbi:MAG: multiple cyclophane-containing RiPP AmcA [Stackebrandtia sp.]